MVHLPIMPQRLDMMASSMTFGDDGVTLDLAEIDGGTRLPAGLTTLPDPGSPCL